MSARFSPDAQAELDQILARYPVRRAAVMPTLWLAQREFGWISQEVAEYVGGLMGYPASDVLSVATFYSLLNKQPRGKFHLEMCRNVSCWLMGAYPCIDEIKRQLGVEANPDLLLDLLQEAKVQPRDSRVGELSGDGADHRQRLVGHLRRVVPAAAAAELLPHVAQGIQ